MFVQKNIAIYLRIGCVYCVTKVIYCVTGVQMSFFRHFSMELTQYLGKLIPVETSTKESNQYVMFCTMGHDGTNCKGCITMNGQTLHVDCQGAGNVCRKSSSIALSYDASNNLTACTLDTFGLTNLDIFNMPARSLSLEIDEGVYSYLNIPSQLVYRDTTTLQFTFTGLSFTSKPLY